VPLTDNGLLLDNPNGTCGWCELTVKESNPERLAPWAPEELREAYRVKQHNPRPT
jgi:hypothetical protein